MILKNIFAGSEHKARKEICTSIEFAGTLLATCILFAVLVLNNGLASLDNSSDGDEVNIIEGAGFPTESVDSVPISMAISAPTALTANIVSPSAIAALNKKPALIALTWIDASDNEEMFEIWRSDDIGGYTKVGEVPRAPEQSTATGDTLRFDDTNLVAEEIYSYYLVAVNADDSSMPSDTATIDFSVPAAPSGLTGTAAWTGSRYIVTLNWIDNTNNENGFRIQRYISPNFSRPKTYSVDGDTTSFVDRNAPRYSRGYYYRVQAFNPVGSSGWVVVHIDTP